MYFNGIVNTFEPFFSDVTLVLAVSIAAGALVFGILIISITICIKKRYNFKVIYTQH